jgi:pyruvate,water dikinase
MGYIKKFEDLGLKDIAQVGGKNASLGEMITQLGKQGIRVPTGFALTADAYWHVINENNLLEKLRTIMAPFKDKNDLAMLAKIGKQARSLIEDARMPDDLAQEIIAAYQELSQRYKQKDCDVAVRSSATAEDSPEASFAGQQETYLNVKGDEQLLKSCQKCMASLFTDRAIIYRLDKGFDHFTMAISVGVQKMVRSDLAVSGVAFSLDTESGFKDIVMINSSYGLGESIVQGAVVPDEFFVDKPTLIQSFKPIIKKQVGSKLIKKIYSEDKNNPVIEVPVPVTDQEQFSLTDEEILELARDTTIIEKHYSDLRGSWMPMDIEWAKDGKDGKIYIIQARPETVHSAHKNNTFLMHYSFTHTEADLEKLIITTGQSIGQKIASGKARSASSLEEAKNIQAGDILITRMTNPDWVPIMKRVAGIITTSGGRTCHAAIVSRELGMPAIVGAEKALDLIKDGQEITIDCSKGKTGIIYKGKIPFTAEKIEIKKIPKPPVELLLNIAMPDRAFTLSFLPVSGVGLARIEFIIADTIGIHPMAFISPEKVDEKVREQIKKKTIAYPDPQSFFVNTLAQEVGTIAAAFYPRPVIVRFSDLKTNEYRDLLGGTSFEPIEDNPMIGFRGASRYYDERYKQAFALECAAMKKVREEMGFVNVKVMIPFVRTADEAQRVLQEMKKSGLERGKNGLEVLMMIEIPADVLMIDDFGKLFDGFSIGSNDLTQMTLSVDRDSPLVSQLFDERLPAIKKMLELAVEGAHRNKKKIGICGQAPADYPEIADFLIKLGIDSISVDAQSVIPFLVRLKP